jgi:hypothetical protein
MSYAGAAPSQDAAFSEAGAVSRVGGGSGSQLRRVSA